MEKTACPLALDPKLCCACAGCIAVCPCFALGMDKLTLAIDAAKCNGCGLCVHFCPAEALSLEH